MKSTYIYTAIALFFALVGTNLIIQRQSFASVIVGFVMVGLTGPYLYYAYNKIRYGYHGSREADALHEAQRELEIRGKPDGKK